MNINKVFCMLVISSFLVSACSPKTEAEERLTDSISRLKASVGFQSVEGRIKSGHDIPQILDWGEEKHLLLRQYSEGSFQTSYIWAIRGGKPMLLLALPNYCFIDNSWLAVVKTFTSNSAGGRIWQRYYLYWDKENERYQEYAARKITEEEFLSLENAKEVKAQIEAAIREEIGENAFTEIQAEDYIKRDNGIININYRILCGEETTYRYAILTEQEGKICQNILPANNDRLYEWGYIFESGDFNLETANA